MHGKVADEAAAKRAFCLIRLTNCRYLPMELISKSMSNKASNIPGLGTLLALDASRHAPPNPRSGLIGCGLQAV